MDSACHSQLTVTLGIWLLLQFLTIQYTDLLPPPVSEEECATDQVDELLRTLGGPSEDPLAGIHAGLQAFPFCSPLFAVTNDLGFWVKSRSTTWFSRFLMEEYNDRRWIQMFRMPKCNVIALAELLAPQVWKKDTKYKVAIPVLIRVACTLFKLTHGMSFFICSKLFAIGKSTVCAVLQDVVHAINETLRHKITWPRGDELQETEQKFAELCGLLGVVGAIDSTHVAIGKPRLVAADYYYFKSRGYSLNCQAVVNSEKRFLDLYLGMPGSTNDLRMLRRSSLYELASHNNLFDNHFTLEGFSPYLLGDSGYPLLPWLMVPHRSVIPLSLADVLFNKRLRKGRCVVENAFGILKQTFRELLEKSELDVAFLPDVILCCAILHNVLLDQSDEDVQNLFGALRTKGLDGKALDDSAGDADACFGDEGGKVIPETAAATAATNKRWHLGLHLAAQRPH